MLVLSRKVGEAIMIGDDIRVVAIEVRGGKVRLGIDAPAGVVVDRQEVHEKRTLSSSGRADPAISLTSL